MLNSYFFQMLIETLVTQIENENKILSHTYDELPYDVKQNPYRENLFTQFILFLQI